MRPEAAVAWDPWAGMGEFASRMKRLEYASAVLLALSLVVLAGCENATLRLDPLSVNGRDGGISPLDPATLMRIGEAAHAGGDLTNALRIYRQAATLEPTAAAPFVAAGNTLVEMDQVNEAILTYQSALERQPRDPEALRGLARAYLKTARPELAGAPLQTAYEDSPNDPKLLQLIGVADDLLGQHAEAQARYRRGLELLPADVGLKLDLALSLALTGDYDKAIAELTPIANSPMSTPPIRQALALVYGLKGDRPMAERLGQIDLEPSSVQHNLAYYDRLRQLSPSARTDAVRLLEKPQANPVLSGSIN